VKIFANFAKQLATLSKCTERKVAAVITDKNLSQVYSIGINGGPKGLVDCMCTIDGKYGCIHAEINALVKCESEATDKVMFVTLSPCKQCAAAIINAPGSFSTIYYLEEWKDTTGIKLLKAAGINVISLQEYENNTVVTNLQDV
jgi:deoxycytidylate deaminase